MKMSSFYDVVIITTDELKYNEDNEVGGYNFRDC